MENLRSEVQPRCECALMLEDDVFSLFGCRVSRGLVYPGRETQGSSYPHQTMASGHIDLHLYISICICMLACRCTGISYPT